MVLKQGEGYKPRGKTSAIVGTSKVQLQFPSEAGPGQAWAGKQKQGPMSRGQWSMEPSQGAASSFTSGYERTGGGLQKQLWKTPTSPLPVEGQPLQGALHLPHGSLAAVKLCMWNLSQTWHTWESHTGTVLPGACCSTGADPGEMDAWAARHQTGLSRWRCALLHPRAEKTFLLSGMECLESQYLLLLASGCWQRYH